MGLLIGSRVELDGLPEEPCRMIAQRAAHIWHIEWFFVGLNYNECKTKPHTHRTQDRTAVRWCNRVRLRMCACACVSVCVNIRVCTCASVYT